MPRRYRHSPCARPDPPVEVHKQDNLVSALHDQRVQVVAHGLNSKSVMPYHSGLTMLPMRPRRGNDDRINASVSVTHHGFCTATPDTIGAFIPGRRWLQPASAIRQQK